MNRIMIHYFNHTGRINGYDVRIVNSWSAYDWLKNETITTITKTIQNVKIDETVCSLIKLALLKEHGGILISNLHFIMIEKNFDWIEKMFFSNDLSDEEIEEYYQIRPNEAEVYVPLAHPTPQYNYYFN